LFLAAEKSLDSQLADSVLDHSNGEQESAIRDEGPSSLPPAHPLRDLAAANDPTAVASKYPAYARSRNLLKR